MSRLDDFLGRTQGASEPSKYPEPQGVEWYASVACQVCGEYVDEQTLFPNDGILMWKCSQGHRSFIEGYISF